MAVDDGKVRVFMMDALSAAGSDSSCCGQICKAFRILQAKRRVPGASLDLNLAAAEHYMFAKCLVCNGTVSKAQMELLIFCYDAKKWLDSKTGNPDAEKTTANPVSPPDEDVRRWGKQGATDGDADHDRCNADASPPFWRPLKEVFGPGKGYGPY